MAVYTNPWDAMANTPAPALPCNPGTEWVRKFRCNAAGNGFEGYDELVDENPGTLVAKNAKKPCGGGANLCDVAVAGFNNNQSIKDIEAILMILTQKE